MEQAVSEAKMQYRELCSDGFGGFDTTSLVESLRNRQLCLAQICYLESIAVQIREIGSRGGSIVLGKEGVSIHPKLDDKWRLMKENLEKREAVMLCGMDSAGNFTVDWEPCRPVPEPDGWFESVWREFRAGKGGTK